MEPDEQQVEVRILACGPDRVDDLAQLTVVEGTAAIRQASWLLQLSGRVPGDEICPLGAGALAGSSLPLDPASVASELGFGRSFQNSMDAVSDRDFVAEALKPGSRLPLMTVRFDGTPFNYDTQLKSVLDLAQTRRPDAKYHVVTVVPASGDPEKDSRVIENGRYDVRRLEDAMTNDGVAGDDIRTSARTEKGVTAREIRIYVE